MNGSSRTTHAARQGRPSPMTRTVPAGRCLRGAEPAPVDLRAYDERLSLDDLPHEQAVALLLGLMIERAGSAEALAVQLRDRDGHDVPDVALAGARLLAAAGGAL